MSESRKKKLHPLRAAWDILVWVLIAIVVLAAILLVGVRLFGLRPYMVLSGSMEPTYHTGSVVYVKEVDYRTLEVGDPITFMVDETTVATHRIVEVVPDETDAEVIRYRTKGDNNDTADGGWVHCRNIIGAPVFSIPYLGYAVNYIQHPPGTYVALTACAVLVLMTFLPDLFEKPEEPKERKTNQEIKNALEQERNKKQ